MFVSLVQYHNMFVFFSAYQVLRFYHCSSKSKNKHEYVFLKPYLQFETKVLLFFVTVALNLPQNPVCKKAAYEMVTLFKIRKCIQRERERERKFMQAKLLLLWAAYLESEQLSASVRDIDMNKRAGNAEGLQEKLHAVWAVTLV